MRNGQRSSRGRAAIARKSQMFAGVANGNLPQVSVVDHTGQTIRNAMFFGGSKKAGLEPRATGYYVAPSSSHAMHPAVKSRPNFLFIMKTQIGLGPRGLPSGGRVQ